ncbi:hypothetical protein V6N12_040036 [Hibiscus sabdariffa]|uniref:Uncharacterized protein n=1 Tax=Hibiscus sabdariffa TaxID=183260 RepID=A0ABR2E4D0_9ROSI
MTKKTIWGEECRPSSALVCRRIPLQRSCPIADNSKFDGDGERSKREVPLHPVVVYISCPFPFPAYNKKLSEGNDAGQRCQINALSTSDKPVRPCFTNSTRQGKQIWTFLSVEKRQLTDGAKPVGAG